MVKYDGTQLLCIPNTLVEHILHIYHNSDMTAHPARDRLYKILRSRFYWYGMYSDVAAWVNSCTQCQTKSNQPLGNGLLVSIFSSKSFETISIDIAGPFKTTPEGNKYILVCVDMLTNWVEAYPLQTIEAVEVCRIFFKIIIARHGCPEKVLTDKGRQFTSKLFNKLCHQCNIKHIESSAYHHETNGTAEKLI